MNLKDERFDSFALVASAPSVRHERMPSRNERSRRDRSSTRVRQNFALVPAAARNELLLNFKLERKETISDRRFDSQFAHLTHHCHDGRLKSIRETKATNVHRDSGSPRGPAPHSCAVPGGGHDPRGTDRLAHSPWLASDEVRNTNPSHLGGEAVTTMTNTNTTASAIASPITQDALGLAGRLAHPNAPTSSAFALQCRDERGQRKVESAPASAGAITPISIWGQEEGNALRSSQEIHNHIVYAMDAVKLDRHDHLQERRSKSPSRDSRRCLGAPPAHHRGGNEWAPDRRGELGVLRGPLRVSPQSRRRLRDKRNNLDSGSNRRKPYRVESPPLSQFSLGLAGCLAHSNAPTSSALAQHCRDERGKRDGAPAPASAGANSR